MYGNKFNMDEIEEIFIQFSHDHWSNRKMTKYNFDGYKVAWIYETNLPRGIVSFRLMIKNTKINAYQITVASDIDTMK